MRTDVLVSVKGKGKVNQIQQKEVKSLVCVLKAKENPSEIWKQSKPFFKWDRTISQQFLIYWIILKPSAGFVFDPKTEIEEGFAFIAQDR